MMSTETIRNRVASIKARIEKAEAQRADALEKISRAAVDDAPINGALRERDEADARIDALTREQERLETEELPIAREAEARAARVKALTNARTAHASHRRLAAQFDSALARANAALADLMENEPAYKSAMAAARLTTGLRNWPLRLSLAMWAATARGGAGRVWSAWSGQRGAVGGMRPVLAMALGLHTGPKAHVRTLAEQLDAFAPTGGEVARRSAEATPPQQPPPDGDDPLALPEQPADDPLELPGDAEAARARRKADYARAR